MRTKFSRVIAITLAITAVGAMAQDVSALPAGSAATTGLTLNTPSGTATSTFSLSLASNGQSLANGTNTCPGDTTTNPAYRWATYMVPKAADPAVLTYNTTGPILVGPNTFVQPLFSDSGASQVNKPPGLNDGLITPIPSFSFNPLSVNGAVVPNGVYKIGFACYTAGATAKFWQTPITVSGSVTSAGTTTFNWVAGDIPAAPVLASPLTAGNGTLAGTFTPTASTPATTGYTVTAVPTAGATVNLSLAGGATNFTFTGLTNGTQYAVSITATNSLGTSGASNTVNGTPGTVPAAPVLASPLTAGNGTLAGTFTPTASTPATTGYTVTAVPTAGATVNLSLAAGATNFNLTGLTNGTQYAVTVTATNSIGSSASSNLVNGTPVDPVAPGTIPAAPALASPLTAGNGTLAGAFIHAASSPATTGYTVTAVPTSGGAVNLSLSAGATNFVFTGLLNGTQYAVSVTATNSLGTSASSNTVNGTPLRPPFVGFAPSRLLDTRTGFSTVDNQFAGIGLRAADSVTQLAVAGRAGVPADASAVVLNVTATSPTGAGYVTVFPCGSDRPTASSLNYVAGATVPNAVISKLGTNGTICLYTQAATHLIVDINGFFPNGAAFSALNPARLLETRSGLSTIDGQSNGIGARAADSVTELQVTGRAGVPADAGAAVLNVTVTEAQGAGYVTVFPCGSTRPNASSLNYVAGSTVANAVISKIGAGGKVCLYTQAGTHMIVDINGYLPGNGGFTALDPARVLESRPGLSTVDGIANGIGVRPADSITEVQIAGRAGVPADASSAELNVTVVGPAGAGFVTVFPCGGERPNSSNLNYTPGTTVANASITKIGTGGKICFYTQAAADLIVDVNGYFAS